MKLTYERGNPDNDGKRPIITVATFPLQQRNDLNGFIEALKRHSQEHERRGIKYELYPSDDSPEAIAFTAILDYPILWRLLLEDVALVPLAALPPDAVLEGWVPQIVDVTESEYFRAAFE